MRSLSFLDPYIHLFFVQYFDHGDPAILSDVQVIDLTLNPIEGYKRLWSGLNDVGIDARDLFIWDGTRPPYPGLLAFQEQDAAIYFGRNPAVQEIIDILTRLQGLGGPRFILVLGPSGSGKSSLVRAGVIPRLKRDKDRWLVLEPFCPRERPFDALAMVLAEAFASFGSVRDWKTVRDMLNRSVNENAGSDELRSFVNDLRVGVGRPEVMVLLIVDQLEEVLGRDTDPTTNLFH